MIELKVARDLADQRFVERAMGILKFSVCSNRCIASWCWLVWKYPTTPRTNNHDDADVIFNAPDISTNTTLA